MRHLLLKDQATGEEINTEGLPQQVSQTLFETALNEMIGSYGSLPPDVYLDILGSYTAEVTQDNCDFQDPWMSTFLKEEIERLAQERPIMAEKELVTELDMSLVEASQQLIRSEGSSTAKKSRKRKPTKKERTQQKRMMREVEQALRGS